MDKKTLLPAAQKPIVLPFFLSKISAGFPSPADDFIERHLDLNELLIKHPAATFFVKVQGESMINAGIHDNDILVVDRSLTAENGTIIIGTLNGEFLVKRLKKYAGRMGLFAENVQFKPIFINDSDNFEVWGVVTNVIHSF